MSKIDGLTNEEIMKVAKACHEVNRAFCEAHGDRSQLPWEQAPGWQKRSAFIGVKTKLLNPDITSEGLHESWMEEKKKDGWVYGEVKDPEKKTHPAMVPYDKLPQFQKTKDLLFGSVVESFREEVLGGEVADVPFEKMTKKELEEKYPNIAELKPKNKKEFINLLLSSLEVTAEEVK